MDSISRVFKSGPSVGISGAARRRNPWLVCWVCLFAGLCGAAVQAQTEAREDSYFKVHEARSLLVDGVYRVSAQVDYQLGDQALEALLHGVPLVLELQIQVLQQREWLWSETVAQLRQRYQLRYHALSQRYLVLSFNTGVQQSFNRLGEALHAIGTLYDLPLIDARLLATGGHYQVRLRADLDIEELPTPIRLWAYLSSGWGVNSEWYTWPLEP